MGVQMADIVVVEVVVSQTTKGYWAERTQKNFDCVVKSAVTVPELIAPMKLGIVFSNS